MIVSHFMINTKSLDNRKLRKQQQQRLEQANKKDTGKKASK